MKKSLLLSVALVTFFAGSAIATFAQTQRLWVPPKAGIWKLVAEDEEKTNWTGHIKLAKRSKSGQTVKYSGYFYWISDDKETSGREYFRGSFDRSNGKLRLNAYAVKNERGELGIGNYVARVNRKGRNIGRGRWSGAENVPGKWSAVWLKAK